MMNDIDIKNKRILLFDFDGTLIETASGNTFATDLTDMRIKMDVVNKALDLMQENGVKVFAIVSNQAGMIDDVLMECKDTVMRGMNFSQLKGCSLMVGDASGLPGQFSDSDKVCAENAGIDYMDVTRFVGKDLDLNL